MINVDPAVNFASAETHTNVSVVRANAEIVETPEVKTVVFPVRGPKQFSSVDNYYTSDNVLYFTNQPEAQFDSQGEFNNFAIDVIIDFLNDDEDTTENDLDSVAEFITGRTESLSSDIDNEISEIRAFIERKESEIENLVTNKRHVINGSSDEESLKQMLQSLIDSGKFEYFYSEDDSIIGVTTPITLEGHDLGKYHIVIQPSRGYRRIYVNSNSHDHPHVSSSSVTSRAFDDQNISSMCPGNKGTDIRTAFSRNNLADIFLIGFEILNNYDESGAFRSMEDCI